MHQRQRQQPVIGVENRLPRLLPLLPSGPDGVCNSKSPFPGHRLRPLPLGNRVSYRTYSTTSTQGIRFSCPLHGFVCGRPIETVL